MEATSHQLEKINAAISLVDQGHKRIIISGSAGVGKTFAAKVLLDHYLKKVLLMNQNAHRWAPGSIYVTAPTNKALSILQQKIPPHNNIVFKTTHSALKLTRIVEDKKNSVYFAQMKNDKNPPFDGCVMALVDECSMLESKILDMLDDFPFPIIFIGDNQQLNPIKEYVSPVFNRGYPTVELTEIIRQGEGNPIIELSRNLHLIKTRQPNLTSDNTGYIFQNDRTKIIQNLAEVNGTDELKYLAYTNIEVDSTNKRVRELLYGDRPAIVELGETLVMDAPKGEHWTNQEVKVEDLKIITEQVLVPTSYTKFTFNGPINCEKIKMRVYRVNDDFNIVQEHSVSMFNHILAALVTNCSKFGWSWKCKFFFEEQFAKTKYNHAITVHKSQGSTYKEAVMNVGNINYNRNDIERTRMLYTGVTRASKLLVLNNV